MSNNSWMFAYGDEQCVDHSSIKEMRDSLNSWNNEIMNGSKNKVILQKALKTMGDLQL